MHLPIIGIVVLIALGIALAALKAAGATAAGKAKADVYYLKASMFSPAERSFLGVLEALNLDGVTIASKVRLADIFGIKRGLTRGDRLRALNRIAAKHVDFLLIQATDGRPLLGIELDDGSHDDEQRFARDSFVDTVYQCARLPILHVAAKRAYDPKEIRRRLDEALAHGC